MLRNKGIINLNQPGTVKPQTQIIPSNRSPFQDPNIKVILKSYICLHILMYLQLWYQNIRTFNPNLANVPNCFLFSLLLLGPMTGIQNILWLHKNQFTLNHRYLSTAYNLTIITKVQVSYKSSVALTNIVKQTDLLFIPCPVRTHMKRTCSNHICHCLKEIYF